ncbi:amino acid adenylation protein [Streptomyces chrestomyceticus JCM 4735]|uniref:Amino acid adenylation protein n=1 Tax=Streptomyces chrestomyceticus JCM 4735 TaxID=1306181 RepID=A0A7U9KR74_9ACTN|nr:non-ribosomal peptide synthetase [Streptomyces chrestomyceticus]GCD33108.1 amino acid adenylation protein [Streptomyces chrestomyceticus JCM 4735]
MAKSAEEAGRAFWRGVFDGGGFTAVPRWAHRPVPGLAEYRAAVPAGLVTELGRVAEELAVPLRTVLLAAHAKVLAALTGEPEVTTGYAATAGGRALPCRLTAAPGSWRALVLHTRRAESRLLAHQDVRPEPTGLPDREPLLSEVVFAPHDTGDGLPEDVVLSVGIVRCRGRLIVRLRHRTDALDTECAARIAGYHLTALALIAADPHADHTRQSLLSADELHHQLEGLAGPRRDLPDRRAHELFEQQAAAHPDAVAAVQGDRSWTYAQLNAHANQLGRALLARGLRREGVVAVVTERNLDWTAAVLAVLKAGGVYLPIEPHFPADRIAKILARSGCALVLTEHGSTATLDQALKDLPEVRCLTVGTAYAEEHADGGLGVTVTAGQLAYIYFTSGSTGEPKGAMCEHAGLLNHLFAKIDDLEIGPGRTVAQTAPRCFDISLWQLIAALLVGGRTFLVEQDAILDVPRFVDRITEGRVNVLQVVPSYLEAVLSYLEQHPRALPDLRYVSATGEALKPELAQRWFAARPGTALVNAYGLTETSDDTNHEVMRGAPDGARVPLGPPVANVRVYVVDEHLAPVPLGAPGAIVFSGVCVGRGYVNDPERTRVCFGTDPHRPGQRLYQGGDFGRWRPDGKLDYLGRRDAQVKVRGFRIETGEVENALLRVPGVRDGAVIVTERAGQGARLVAFYRGPRPLATDLLRSRLAQSLPAYMVPSAFHRHDGPLPLTANSKTDRKALAALAAGLDDADGRHLAPRTPAERRLATAWATVLGVPQDRVGRRDHFFDRGGTSLAAVKLAILLDRAVSLKDVTRHPVLADLADVLDGRSRQPGAALLRPLTAPDGAHDGALVCFPWAGADAAAFQPLADALRDSGRAVYAVELPGRDTTARPVEVAEAAAEIVAGIVRLGLTGPLLWGHASGAAYAVEAARQLEERGTAARRLFIGARWPGDGHDEHADDEPAHHHLTHALAAPLSTPVTAVVAADDPRTARFRHRHQDWRPLAEHVELYVLTAGGHHFPRTRPADTARAVLHAAELRTSP